MCDILETPWPLPCNPELKRKMEQEDSIEIYRIKGSCKKSVKILQDFVDGKEPSHE